MMTTPLIKLAGRLRLQPRLRNRHGALDRPLLERVRHAALACTLGAALAAGPGFAALGYFSLGEPQYGECGTVTINGYVSDNPDSLTWNWGDGSESHSWFAAAHEYKQNGTYTVCITAHPREETVCTSVTISTAGLAACACRPRLTPGMLTLRDGTTSGQFGVEIRDANGRLVTTSGLTITWSSSDPNTVSVDSSGRVRATGFGSALITASISGYREASAWVHAGSFRVTPPIMLLSLEPGHNTGQLVAEVRNADGTPVDLSGRQLEFQPGNYVASVDPQTGAVVARGVPTAFSDTPAICAVLDGLWSSNAAILRVTSTTLGLVPTGHPTTNVDFWFASPVSGYDYVQVFADHHVAVISQAAYEYESELLDAEPFAGDVQFLVNDPGYASDGTVPCGLSGNPIRLGTDLDKTVHNSCFVVAFPPVTPHWGVYFHEMGHNFAGQSVKVNEFTAAGSPNSNAAYGEGLATAAGIYVAKRLEEDAPLLGISDALVREVKQCVGYFGELDRLDAYVAAGADYARIDADVLDGILATAVREYGLKVLFRLFSLFVPAHESLPFGVSSDTEQATLFVAAMSVAAGQDLRSRFQDEWGFPLDQNYYTAIYPTVRSLVLQRGSEVNPGES